MFGSTQLFGATQPGNDTSMTQAGGARPPRQEEKMTCLPVTIRAMENSVAERAQRGMDEIKFYDHEPSILIVVAAVETISKQATCLEMTLNDGTGRMKARYFFNDSGLTGDDITVGKYISAFGMIRAAPTTHFAISNFKLVESADEVSYHTIETAHAYLKLKSMGDASATKPVASTPSAAPVPTPMDTSGSAPQVSQPAAAAPAETPAALSAPVLQGKALESEVLRVLRGDGVGDEGLTTSVIVDRIGKTTLADVKSMLNQLVDEGECYNTIDEQSFAAV